MRATRQPKLYSSQKGTEWWRWATRDGHGRYTYGHVAPTKPDYDLCDGIGAHLEGNIAITDNQGTFCGSISYRLADAEIPSGVTASVLFVDTVRVDETRFGLGHGTVLYDTLLDVHPDALIAESPSLSPAAARIHASLRRRHPERHAGCWTYDNRIV